MSNIGLNWGYIQNFMTLVPKMRSGGSKIQNSPIFIRSGADDALNHIVEQFYNPHMTSYAWILKKNDQFKVFCKILDKKIFLVHFRQGGSAGPPSDGQSVVKSLDLKGLRLNDTHGYLLRRWRGYNELEVYCILNSDCQNYAVSKHPLQRFKSNKICLFC